MGNRIFFTVVWFCAVPLLGAQTQPSDPDPSQNPPSSTRPYQTANPPQQTGSDQRGVPCGPGGCIVSNDQTTTPREAGAEGQQIQTPNARKPVPNGVTPDYDDRRRRQADEAGDPSRRPELRPRDREEMTQFQKFVEDSTGRALPIYGRTLFLNTPADFLPATSVSPPADYVVGSGDQLKVRTWGNVSIDVLSTVDRNGQVYVPQIGTLTVAGLPIAEAQSAIRAAIRKQYTSFDLSVTLGQLRSIQVFVLGEARHPGVYTVSSLSTLVNALFTSGGATAVGSLRDVQLKRDGQTVTHFDVYGLLLQGDKTKDVPLRPGDIIFIPGVGPQVAVDGEVSRPAIYELRGETSVQALIALAGGLTPLAGRERASLDRIADDGKRSVQDFPLTGAERLIEVRTGDLLNVFPISSKIGRAVTLQGHVNAPGRYPWREGMRVTDLIPNRQFLLTRNYFNKQNVLKAPAAERPFGVSEENEGRTNGSIAAISTDRATAAATDASVFDQETTVELGSHDTEINWSYAAIERLSPGDLSAQMIPFALGDAVDHPGSPENKILEPGDVVVVYSSKDLNLPVELRAQFVRIDGEVNRPGIYRIHADETLRELLVRAGGIAPHGYPYASQLIRESVRIAQEAKLRALVKQESESVLSPLNRTISSDGKAENSDLELRKAYIGALSQAHATGRVILGIAPNAASAVDLPEVPLQDRDHYFIPSRPSTVDVIGNVYNQGSMRFTADSKVSTYLREAGGNTREGDKPREFILRADGTVLSRAQVGRFDRLLLYPGDTVVVPARLKPGFNLYDLLAYTQLTSSFALTAVAVHALN